MKFFNINKLSFRKIALLLFAIIGIIYIRYNWINAENEKFGHTLQNARSIAAMLPVDDLKALDAIPGDIDKPQYQVIKKILQEIILVNPKATFAYIYIERNNKIYFVADSEPADSKDYSPPGQEYSEASDVDKLQFSKGEELISYNKSDRWGTWTSVLIPIKDKNTGRTVAVFGMDYNANSWGKSVIMQVLQSIVLIVLLLFTLFFVFSFKANNKLLKFDIRERSRIEKVLRRSEEKYRHLFANNPQPMWMYDLETLAFLEVNEAAVNHYGYSREEFLQMTIKDIRPDEDIPALMQNIELTGDEYNQAGQWRHKRKSGEIIFVEINSHSLIFNGRKARNVLIHDVTGRKRAEEELQFRNAILSNQQEVSIDGILIVDENAKIISYNNRFVKLWGIPPTLLADHDDKPVLEFVMNKIEDPQSFLQRIRHLNEHKRETGRDEIILKNGRTFDRYSAPMRGLDDRYYGRIWYFRDITDSKRAKEALLASRTQLTNIIEFLPDATLALDNERRVIIWNKAIEEMTGIPAAEMIGKGDYAYTIPFFGEARPQLMDLLFMDDSEIGATYRNITREGETIIAEVFCNALYNNKGAWLLAKVSPLHDHSGNIIGAIESLRDISQSKLAQQELFKSKELAEENNKLKTAFLNNISHEIRTPFNSILGFLSIIQENGLETSEKEEYFGIINQSADRLMNTINDIVEISQIQAGQIIVSESETNIRKLTSEVYNHFKNEAENKGLKFFIYNALPVNIDSIYTDNIKLNSILTILIGNAIKFTPKGSIEFGIHLSGDYIQFSVKDTGIGIVENKQQAIFERFMQGDGSNTRQYEGSGLGLSIAKAYVEMLGGKISVESTEGKGAEFRFTILHRNKTETKPANGKMILADRDKHPIYPDASGLKILIVEDDEGSAMLISLAVRKFGKEIIKVRTGKEAIEACRRNPDIDLVLMDIKMPEMDGYEATEQIRQFNKDVIIIAQTAYALRGDSEKTIAAGCNDYIAKPIRKEKLSELMQKHFNKITRE